MSSKSADDTIEKENIKEPKRYNILALDNDVTSWDEVVFILMKSFRMSRDEANSVTQLVHTRGRGVCNKEPLAGNLADFQLQLVDRVKQQLAKLYPARESAIGMLTFIKEEA